MSETKSPDGTYPTWPATLPVDGEFVTNDVLFTSLSADRGIIGKLIDAVGYLKARSPQLFRIRTDGTGGLEVKRRTPIDDGATAFFSSVAFQGTTAIRCTFGTAAADDDDYVILLSRDGSLDWIGGITNRLASRFDLVLYDVSTGGAVDLTTNISEIHMAVFPNLAGMT
jgi:hypothetical protein